MYLDDITVVRFKVLVCSLVVHIALLNTRKQVCPTGLAFEAASFDPLLSTLEHVFRKLFAPRESVVGAIAYPLCFGARGPG